MRTSGVMPFLLLVLPGCASESEPSRSSPNRKGPTTSSEYHDQSEYLLRPRNMKASGDFNTFKLDFWPGTGSCWLSQKEIDTNLAIHNYVECAFAATAGSTYRCWAYLGGCCLETFDVFYQTTEGTARMGDKEYSIEPGGRGGYQLPIDWAGLSTRHEAHGGERQPSVWRWIEIPLPKSYPSTGLKTIRILSCQKGFAVACIKVASMGSEAPQGPPPPEK